MKTTEPDAKPIFPPQTGRFATLRALLGLSRADAPSHRRAILALASALATTALLLAPAPVLAKPIHVFKTAFGSSSSNPPNPYPLVGPSAVAVDQASEDIYVTSPGIDERQVITTPDTGSGTFTLSFKGQTTPPLDQASGIPGALEALSTIGSGNLDLIQMIPGDVKVYTFRFINALGGTDVPQITADSSSRSAGPVTVTTSRAGAPGHAVEKFTPSGEFVAIFGKEVNKTKVQEAGSTEASQNLCTAASGDTCRVGTSSSVPGGFQDPAFVAVDNSPASKGDVYVADSTDHLVTKFDPEGHLISTWGKEGQLGETPITATGTGDVAADSATGTGDLKAGDASGGTLTAGSTTVTFTPSPSATFAVGMEFEGAFGIPDGTKITAVGPGTLTLSNPATVTGKEVGLTAGSKSITSLNTSTGAFTAGLGIQGPGIRGNTYITAVGPGTLTLSRPAAESQTATHLTTNTRFVTNLITSTGAFETSQTISGAGIPAGTKIEEVGPGFLALKNNASAGGTGVPLSAKFVFGTPLGIAVDPSGNVWLSAAFGGGHNQTFEYTPGGALVTDWAGGGGLAIESTGDLFAFNFGVGTEKLSPSGARLGNVDHVTGENGTISGLAVDPVSDDLYVDEGSREHPGAEVVRYTSSCEPAAGFCTPAEVFGVGTLVEGQGIAAASNHSLYVADSGDSTVKVFEQVNVPTATTGQVSNLAQATATLNGEVNPEGVAVSECRFEYVEAAKYQPKAANPYAAGQTAPCVESAGSGNSPVAVHADISGLAPASYHFRLFAKNENGADRGADHILGASVDSSAVTSATTSEATLSALINPNGLDTTCQLQYVAEADFDVSQFANATTLPCEPAGLGSGSADQGASAVLTGLQPGTAYRYRFLATSAGHTTEGPAEPLYTHSSKPASSGCANEVLRTENTSLNLPDCRAYEQVSPPDNAEVYVPDTQNLEGGLNSSQWPMQASTNGEAVTYVGEAPSSGQGEGSGTAVSGLGDEHLASRGAQGWAAADIIPFGSGGKNYYEDFSDDLSVGIFHTGPPFEPIPTGLEKTCLYSRASADGSFHPLISGECGNPFFAGASADGSHLLFESTAAKTPGAQEAPGEGKENIYDSFAGQLHLVNVLPGSEPKPDPNATVGSLSGERRLQAHEPNTPAINADNVVSADGSRVFWTDLATGIVYVRENPAQAQSKVDKTGKCTQAAKACTVPVSAGAATYQTATPDGRYAYYTETGELWRFDVQEGAREALAAGPAAKVQAVIGVNETGEAGSYLYFVAEGALAAGAEARACKAADSSGSEQEREEAAAEAEGEAPPGRGCNLYLIHAGQTTLAAVLLAADNNFAGGSLSGSGLVGDWRAALGYRSAQLTPDGRHLVFMSERRLTAYDNVNTEGKCGGTVHSCSEIYLYDAEAEPGQQISCASCNPSGAPPIGVPNKAGRSTYLPFAVASITRTPRWISADGSRVFFNSAQHLLPADTNSHQGVYEWERAGAGSCAKGSPANGGGCLYLLSGATATNPAYLVDIDEKGENAFFVTRSNLAPTDGDNKPDLYDARANGGFPVPATLPPCEAAACKGPIAAPPTAKSPGSASFKQPPTVKCKKGKVKKRGKCVSKKHHKSSKHQKRAGADQGGRK